MMPHRRHRRGAEALEVALIMPVLVLIIVGMMDISWLFYTESSLDVSTNLGCRAGALVDPGRFESNIAEVEAVTTAALVTAMNQQGLPQCEDRCEAMVSVFGAQPGRTLRCEVTFDYTPLIGWAVGSMTLSSQQVVRMEWQRQ